MKLLRWLAAVLLLTASLGQLNRLFIGDNTELVLYANDILIGIMAGWYFISAIIARKSWRIPPILLWLFLWFAFCLLGLAIAWTQLGKSDWLVSFSYLLRYGVYAIVLFFLAYDSVVYVRSAPRRQSMTAWWLGIILLSGLLMAVGGYIQLFILPDLAELAKYGWDPHVNRLVTAMLDPNYAGCYLSIMVAVAVSLFLHLKQHYALRAGLLVYTVILLVALLLTYSRSGYIMLSLALGGIAIVKSRLLLVIGIGLAVLTIFSVPRVQTRLVGAFQIDASAQPRIISWQNSWLIAQDNLLLGVGFNSYRYAQDRYGIVSIDKSGNAGAGADSSWLFILATTGLFGFVAYVFSYLGLAWKAIVLYRRSVNDLTNSVSLALVAILFGLAIASQFNNALFYTWILQLIWVLCGLVVGLAEPQTSDA